MRDTQAMQLSDYVSVLNRRKWFVFLAVVLVAGTALLASSLQTPVYQASARLLLERTQSAFVSGGERLDPSFVETEIQVLKSEPVRDLVRKKLGSAPDVSAIPVGLTAVIEVRVQSTSPSRAAALTNGYAESYIEFRQQQSIERLGQLGQELQLKIQDLNKQIEELSRRIAEIPGCTGNNPPANCSQRESLEAERDGRIAQRVPFEGRLDELQVDQSLKDGVASIISRGSVPTEPIRPRPVRNAIIGVGAGLVFGIALAFIFEHLDDSIKTKDDFERVARDVPVLGIIPFTTTPRTGEAYLVANAKPGSPAAEAYRTLRTSIEFVGVERPLRTLQVTSPSASDGKSTTAANLAVILARAGKKVIIVSCDLRRPRMHEFFDVPNTDGFTSVLLGEVPFSSAVRSVDGEPNLQLLNSGPLPPNPSELLSAPRTAELFKTLRERAHIVIVDCPPVLPVTDAAVLSSRVDATLLVVTMGSTTRKQLGRTLEILRQVNAPIIGAVLNRVKEGTSYGYSEYYAYHPYTNGKGNGNGNGNDKKQTRTPAKKGKERRGERS